MQYVTTYKGRCAIARKEACVLKPYPDGDHLSQGYGHNDPSLTLDSPAITFEEAWRWLGEDLKSREKIVNNWLTVEALPHEFDAIISGYYQAGRRMLPVVHLINSGEKLEAMALFLTINRNKGIFSPGLANRRNAEMRLFTSADYTDAAKPKPKLRLYQENPFVNPDYTLVDPPPEETP